MNWIKDFVDLQLSGNRREKMYKNLRRMGLLYTEDKFREGKELNLKTEIALDLSIVFPEEEDYIFQYVRGLEVETIALYKPEMKFYKVINRAQIINPSKDILRNQRQFSPNDNVDFIQKNAGDYIFIESYPEIIEGEKLNLHYEEPFPIVVNKAKLPLEGSKEASIILIDTE